MLVGVAVLALAVLTGCGRLAGATSPAARAGGQLVATEQAGPTVTSVVATNPALPPNPLVSRGKPTAASADVAKPGGTVDGSYCSSAGWRTSVLPTWLAIHLDPGPKRLLLSWNSGYTGDYTRDAGTPSYGIPSDYVIETSPDSTTGADGSWTEVARVKDNTARTRAHSFPFGSATWVRMRVDRLVPNTATSALAIDEIDVHDATLGTQDSVFFMGDSITVGTHSRCDEVQPSFANLIHQAFPAYFPALINGGVGGVTSAYGQSMVDNWLAINPDYQVWAIAYGTNDAWQSVSASTLHQHLQYIIDRVVAANKQPVLARIPYATAGPADAQVRSLNTVIDELVGRNRLLPGPDLYAWFQAHPEELGPDGVHPTSIGYQSISRLWAQALRGRYEAPADTPPASSRS